ncbi:MAG TPA: hypothetical protein VEC16_02710 [Alphaproteobacteria bacterium]|nr:hypothetical protein [Alphaproteobacteria bacterium]
MDAPQPEAELSSSSKGVSNTTIGVLVMLALIFTVIGTWAVLNSINSNNNVDYPEPGTNVGQVSFTVVPASGNYNSKVVGLVSLNIE